jgi:hypothetical protein
MQQFKVEILVTVNTVKTVSEAEVLEYVKDYMGAEDIDGVPLFDIGGVEVEECNEIP